MGTRLDCFLQVHVNYLRVTVRIFTSRRIYQGRAALETSYYEVTHWVMVLLNGSYFLWEVME